MLQNKIRYLSLSLALILTLSGCATIVSDSKYKVNFKSNPSNARVIITDMNRKLVHSGVTPMTVTLDSSNGYFKAAKYNLIFEKPGFGRIENVLESKIDGWYWGNILFGGFIGWLIVDPMTGAMYKLPKDYSVDFYNRGLSSNDLNILSIDQLSEEDKQHLIQIN